MNVRLFVVFVVFHMRDALFVLVVRRDIAVVMLKSARLVWDGFVQMIC
jgi:hypothetical protein